MVNNNYLNQQKRIAWLSIMENRSVTKEEAFIMVEELFKKYPYENVETNGSKKVVEVKKDNLPF